MAPQYPEGSSKELKGALPLLTCSPVANIPVVRGENKSVHIRSNERVQLKNPMRTADCGLIAATLDAELAQPSLAAKRNQLVKMSQSPPCHTSTAKDSSIVHTESGSTSKNGDEEEVCALPPHSGPRMSQ